MANKTLLTNAFKFSSVKQMYYSPIATIPNYFTTRMYCFLSKVDPWLDNENPPDPTQDQKSLKHLMKNIFVVKPIGTHEISPVIARANWTSGTVYDPYSDTIDLFEKDQNNVNVFKFYCNNRYDQVFKCLWNNNSNASTIEPYFEPGTLNPNNIFQGSDGYKWKYLYTIDSASKVNFMDSSWIPVPFAKYSSNPLKYTTAGYGNIDVINVTNGGSGYDSANVAITVDIIGDNSSKATAYAISSNGSISDIVVSSNGSNYIDANVVITSNTGSNASAIAPVSPIGGHGSDPLSELGCCNVMITSTFNGSEVDVNGNPIIPIDITYYQLGILVNPTSIQTAPEVANAATYKTSTDLIVASGFGSYTSEEIVYQGDSLDNATFSATVLSYNNDSNIITIINTSGQLNVNVPLFGDSSGTVRTLLSYSTPDLVTLSGDILYIDNRSGIQRSSDGIEQFKVVLNY